MNGHTGSSASALVPPSAPGPSPAPCRRPARAARAHDRARPPAHAGAPAGARGGGPAPPSAAGPERLSLRDVGVAYAGKEAVRSVSLSIHQGEVLALIGPSGCGKTTLLRTLNRLTELTRERLAHRRRSCSTARTSTTSSTPTCARVWRWSSSSPTPSRCRSSTTSPSRCASRGASARGRRELEPLVIDALRRAGLYDEVRDDLDRPALRLSGGQQQRLCIARAIAPRPEVLLMDEPCSALDPISTGVIEDLIHELRRDLAVVDRHPQPRPGPQGRRQGRVHVPRRPGRVRHRRGGLRGTPRPRTREYVRGAFG